MTPETTRPRYTLAPWLVPVVLTIAAVFYGLCFLHLRADFPNHSPWNDWSKMTDEGWYGGGAIHRFTTGHWLLPGSFNPAVALPVWPAMLTVWFALAGPGMVAARVLTLLLFGISLVCLHQLLRPVVGSLGAAAAAALMTLNPFAWSFDRLAVLEPVMVLWLMAALWLASRTGPAQILRQAGIGGLICLLVLTKTTGLFLAPAVLYQLWASLGWPRRGWLRPLATVAGAALACWLLYYGLFARPNIADYRLLFAINRDRVHLSIVPAMALKTLRDGLWIDRIVFSIACAGLAASTHWLRSLWRVPLFGASVIATTSYLAFIGYHSNLQPRYYLVVAMPVVIVAVLSVQAALRHARPVGFVFAAFLAVAGMLMAGKTLCFALHPEYSFSGVAEDIAHHMRADVQAGPLLSNSGDDITLLTGIPALTVEYSTAGLEPVLTRYRPTWYAAWQGREDPWTARIAHSYRLDEQARYKIFDDPARDTLVLYRMTPKSPVP